jgi:YidC/Oxa1 family membrane protein insertase
MSTKTVVKLFVATLIAFCIAMVIDARHKNNNELATPQLPSVVTTASAADKPAEAPAPKPAVTQTFAPAIAEATPGFSAVVAGAPSTVTLGSSQSDSKYKFEIVFSSRGASISKVTLSQFKDRFDKKKQHTLLAPLKLSDDSETLSMTTGSFAMLDQKIAFPLEQLDWFAGEPVTQADGTQSVAFTASIKQSDSGEVLHIVKTYTIKPDQYHIDCDVLIKNLSTVPFKTRFDMHGPAGIGIESIQRDIRKVIAGYRDTKGQTVTTRVDIGKIKTDLPIDPANAQDRFIWAAVANKYFAAIVVPVPDKGDAADWIFRLTGDHYNIDPKVDPEGNLSFDMRTTVFDLAPMGTAAGERLCRFQIYLGPKDKSLFDSVPLYEKLGFMQTIDFMACCCPAAIIGPIAFGILALMKWTYAIIPNYGVIIILLVLLVRLILHPITKKSQVSMMKMGKLGPKAEEIKKQYADDKQEMNKRLMELYKEAGISPFMGMLPMLMQMPIWIALYSAIYASIDLRGAHFLPFWITDLSAPDAVLIWTPITIPLVGAVSSLNILPILLAIGMYLQQKLTPQPTMQSADSAMAQQQKIMLVMMPAMMLLFLYNAPSGLNLYIMASTFGGIIEQRVIKKHIQERQAEEALGLVSATSKTGGKVKKKKPKPFFKY